MRKSAIISIGNEILLGKTLNTNMSFLAGELALIGVPVEFSLTVKDDADAIRSALNQCWGNYDVVITTGGLGPTADDITKNVIAEFFGKELKFDEAVWEHVKELFAKRNLSTPQINRNQAMVPQGFNALRNDRGTAPGLYYGNSGKCFFAFAGVPSEMRFVFETHVRQILIDRYGSDDAIIQKTLHSFGISESALAEILPMAMIPENVNLAWLPQTGRVDLRFYGNDVEAIDETIKRVLPLVGQYIWGYDEETPTSVLQGLLLQQGLTISVAESCTGGLVQKMLTDVPGASEVYSGGVVTYSNDLKQNILNVREETLQTHGAVSEECAVEMMKGIKSLTNTSAAISVTGLAGPDGGTDLKPVGTVCFSFSVQDEVWCITQIFTGNRETIRHKAAEHAILIMIKQLQERMV